MAVFYVRCGTWLIGFSCFYQITVYPNSLVCRWSGIADFSSWAWKVSVFIRQFTLIDFRFSDFVIFTGPFLRFVLRPVYIWFYIRISDSDLRLFPDKWSYCRNNCRNPSSPAYVYCPYNRIPHRWKSGWVHRKWKGVPIYGSDYRKNRNVCWLSLFYWPTSCTDQGVPDR